MLYNIEHTQDDTRTSLTIDIKNEILTLYNKEHKDGGT